MSAFQNLLDYICDYCSRSFTRKYNLQNHIENCHMKCVNYCEVCDQRFSNSSWLQLHLSRGHNRHDQPHPECDICGRIFTRKQNIISHMITVHMQGFSDFKCKLCIKIFSSKRNLRRHIRQIHDPNIQKPICDICHKTFKGRHTLLQHIKSTHSYAEKDCIKCQLCGKIYTNNRNLKRHIESFHGEKCEYKCNICPKVYISNQNLRRHLRSRHYVDDQNSFQCSYCDIIIPGKFNLDSHVALFHRDELWSQETDANTKTNEFACTACCNVYDEESLLRQHIKTEHTFDIFYKYCKTSLLKRVDLFISKKKTVCYNCEYCDKVFTSLFELKDHMRTNHDKEYSLSTCNVCFTKFYSKENMFEHKKICLPPPNVNTCSHCDKLFTDITSLEFHMKIFHPQAQIDDTNITSANINEAENYKCKHCHRIYYSERSLKHHIKLKHTTDEAMECQYCGKLCSNKYYLASHMKIVHTNDTWSKCDYCDKQFKSKRNIRRHIEFTHMGIQRHKCIECETLFKEKRSLRKHVRSKHPNSASFPQCHICHKRFESAKSCKIHLKLIHSFNMNTYPCDLCSVSFSSNAALTIHLQTKHLAEDEIYKCEDCNLVFKGQENFEQHNETSHVNLVSNIKQKVLPRCIICMKDFSTRKTLKRHIKNFHNDFDVEELANYGSKRRIFNVECEDCIKKFNDDFHFGVYVKLKHLRDSVIFKCDSCSSTYNSLEYFIQRYKLNNFDMCKSKMVLSEFCTAEMSDEEASCSGFGSLHQELIASENSVNIKVEPDYMMAEDDIKTEPLSP
ncbi:uncharacterized protein ACR2FA_010859 [Aphomia sociella]